MSFHATIEQFEPVPPEIRGGYNKGMSKYPFESLEVGRNTMKLMCDIKALRVAIWHYQRQHPGMRFIARNIGGGYCRVWRLQ